MSRQTVHLVLMGSLFLVGCGLAPEPVSRDDERLKPLWAAIARVDRESLGFTAIAPDAKIFLEGKAVVGRNYDARLEIYAETSRTIEFRKVGTDYEWIYEQESHTGPKTYNGVDKEEITITYQTQPVSGAPQNRLHMDILYRGDDPRLVNRYDLTLADVTPTLQEWKQKRPGLAPALNR